MDTKSELDQIEMIENKKDEHGFEVTSEPTWSAEMHKRVRRKLDWHLLPMILALYSLSILDRSNLGNAKVAGMADDLHLTSSKYTWLLNNFYIPYILFEWTTMFWKIFQPRYYVACVVFLWGLDATLQAAAFNWQELMVCRFFLGMIETGFGPGIPLYLSFFYNRNEIGLRIGIFISGSAAANAYGGLLAYGLSNAHTALASWRFLFLVEGIPTMLVAILCLWFIPNGPESARFLTEEERLCAVSRASRSHADLQGSKTEAAGGAGLDFKTFLKAMFQYRNFMTAFMYFSVNVSFASLPVFLPTIIKEMGFKGVEANGLSAPPYAVLWFIIIATTFVSDRFKLRGPFMTFWAIIAAIGFLILGVAKTTAVRYFAIFLAVQIFNCVALNLIWVANNSSSDSSRAGGLVLMQTIGQCGPLLGTNVFPASEGPYYRKGMWICMSFCLLVAVLSFSLTLLLRAENRKRDAKYGEASGTDAFSAKAAKEVLSESDPSFRFVL